MRFLLDQNQSPELVWRLSAVGHDVVHVRDLGLGEASDAYILEVARSADRIVVSGDTDFGDLLARSNASGPSVILLRRQDHRRAAEISALLLLNLDAVSSDLANGAVVVFDEDRLRVRSLPIRPSS